MSPTTDPQLADELVDAVRTFVIKEVLPVASDFEHADEYPHDLVEAMKGLGLMGCMIPPEYGGFGLDAVTYSRIIEELSAGWMSLSGVLNTHTMVATLLKLHGTDKQKSNWLPRMATGEIRGALSLSEPDAGSDTAALRCKATPDGSEYILNGTKMWVTNGVRAGLVALAAKAPEGITCFMVEKEPGETFGGISVSKTIPKLGYKGIETVEMSYNDHRIPAEWVLGGPDAGLGKGRQQILGGLELGRVNIASRAVGVARAAFEAAISYAQQREAFGVPIAKHQAIQFKLADMATRVASARALLHMSATAKDRGEHMTQFSAMTKLLASETAMWVTTQAIQILGGYGYVKEYAVERLFRDAKVTEIYEGTSEIQRIVIARELYSR